MYTYIYIYLITSLFLLKQANQFFVQRNALKNRFEIGKTTKPIESSKMALPLKLQKKWLSLCQAFKLLSILVGEITWEEDLVRKQWVMWDFEGAKKSWWKLGRENICWFIRIYTYTLIGSMGLVCLSALVPKKSNTCSQIYHAWILRDMIYRL